MFEDRYPTPPADQEFVEADRELQMLGEEALKRMAQAGAKEDDIKFVAWLAGLNFTTQTEKRING